MPDFLFITCQIGAERAVKDEIAKRWTDFKFAYSRPGFLTFKLPENCHLADDFDLRSVFARAYAFSLGKVQGQDRVEMAKEVWKIFGHRKVERLHVWQRDLAEPGNHGYEPGITADATDVPRQIVGAMP